eukprot:TRINITY_DN5170_c0_g1_i1.p1 TRINITY_DN5170_c0_g1~~TRINITY_DN5170_c0_g1_i1.p1  ORF type:complete len:365 (+),score=86.37 TRINITY_DN5170_c0_g1_i1:118-1212(+)
MASGAAVCISAPLVPISLRRDDRIRSWCPLKIQSPQAARTTWSSGRRRSLRGCIVMAAWLEEEFDLQGQRIMDDYYSILGLAPDASAEEIKKGYYSCMKACHPDLSNNSVESVAFCTFINEVYEVLSDPEMRAVYDEINGYTVYGTNPFQDTELPRNFTFVDEFTCIGCKNCANTAEATFAIEELYGRARVMDQTGDHPAKIQEAIDTCPVSCIFAVTAPQLSLLEDEMRRIERVNVGVMCAGQGTKGVDVFAQASWRWEKRRSRLVERARVKLMKERGKKMNVWGQSMWARAEDMPDMDSMNRGTSSSAGGRGSKFTTERMAAAAAAARRWREYSQQGVDRRPMKFIGRTEETREEENEPTPV